MAVETALSDASEQMAYKSAPVNSTSAGISGKMSVSVVPSVTQCYTMTV